MESDSLVIKDHYVENKAECKYLGLILDSNLSIQTQIQKIARGPHTIDTIGQQLPTL